MESIILIAVVAVLALFGLPVWALIRTRRIHEMEQRLEGVEAALARLMREQSAAPAVAAQLPEPLPAAEEPLAEEPLPPPPPSLPLPLPPPRPRASEPIEVLIGRRWLAIVAVALIAIAVAFFLKYAFENGWIGELGRVALGVLTGLAIVSAGRDRHRQGWRYLSQVLTAGGIIILYLSIYGSFAYYYLIPQQAAFVVLAIVVAEAHLLAMAYDAPAIAILALTGGFLVPVLLSTGHDNYPALFTYIVLLNIGMLGLVLRRRWRWLGAIAYLGTQVLFWAWYNQHYHVEKRPGVLAFQVVLLALFLVADYAPALRRGAAGIEQLIGIVVHPAVFFATCYELLNGDHHNAMALLALGLALVLAGAARRLVAVRPLDARTLRATVGTALLLVTLAIPIQLDSNWITIGWAAQGLVLLWASAEGESLLLRVFSAVAYLLALVRFVTVDTPWTHRTPFLPVFNRYFLGMAALSLAVAGAAWLCRRARIATMPPQAALSIALAAFGVFWIGSTVETYSYFSSQMSGHRYDAEGIELVQHLRWSGQLALSLLWSTYAGALTFAGFRTRLRALRIAGLVLFGLTLAKVGLIDISMLRQFYRIVALLALGLVLLAVAWAYQRIPRGEGSSR